MPEPLRWRRVGLCEYRDALLLQDACWRARLEGGDDVCLAVEHPPVLTLGRAATDADRAAASALTARGIECVEVERGGRATWHAPGQLVVYPIVGLRARGLGVERFVTLLEEAMIAAAAACGVAAWRDPRGRGVWSAGGKLGAVGIRVAQGVSRHGLALNVANDLAPYAWFAPCGTPGLAVTSLARERGTAVAVGDACTAIEAAFARAFDAPRADAGAAL